MIRTGIKSLLIATFLGLLFSVGALDAATLVFNSHNADPTRDKPQSKVWFAKGWWWAWLPHGDSGGRMWRRTGEEQWMPEEHLDLTLQLLPGRADIWADEEEVVAALVEDSTLAVIRLRWSNNDSRYEPVSIPLVWTERTPVATVTMARQSDGSFWLTYPVDSLGVRKVLARKILPDLRWPVGRPVVLDPSVGPSDVSVITSLDNSLAVVWTDEKDQCFYMSTHEADQPDAQWSEPREIIRGDKDAADMPSLCRPGDGEGPGLIIATRNAVQTVGRPVLGLMVMDRSGQWRKTPFAVLAEGEVPANPVVSWVYSRPMVLYTVYGPPAQGFTANRIMMQQFTPDGLSAQGEPIEVVPQIVGVDYPTTARYLQKNSPCLLLVSDNQGNVIESVIEISRTTGN